MFGPRSSHIWLSWCRSCFKSRARRSYIQHLRKQYSLHHRLFNISNAAIHCILEALPASQTSNRISEFVAPVSHLCQLSSLKLNMPRLLQYDWSHWYIHDVWHWHLTWEWPKLWNCPSRKVDYLWMHNYWLCISGYVSGTKVPFLVLKSGQICQAGIWAIH